MIIEIALLMYYCIYSIMHQVTNKNYVQVLTKFLDSGKLPSYGQLLQYGCWCQLFTQLWQTSNKGTPIDHIDAACRSWSKCIECQMMDSSKCKGVKDTYGLGCELSQNLLETET